MLDVSASLPSSPEGITAEWLGRVLGTRFPAVTVEKLRISRILWGTATKVLLDVTYAGRPGGPVPTNLCLKAGLDDRLQKVSSDAIHAMEARFYGQLRDRLDTPAPRSYYASVDEAGRTGLVILEDLTAAGCRFVEPGDVLTPDQVACGLGHQARWHAATWGTTPADLPGVKVGSMTRKAAKLFFREDYWDAHFAQEDVPRYPQHLQDPHTLYQAFQALWAYDDGVVHCFQHGDAHLGNAFVRPGGDLGFVDWQCYCLGPWSYDVAYFISGALTISDRRAHEAGLLRYYLDQLALAGGPRISFDDAWRDYVRHLVHGLIWTMTPKVMQPAERSRVMSDRHVAAVEDHGVITGA